MSISTEAGIIVGLMYEDIVDSGFDKDRLDELIHDGDVDCGSYGYDTGPDENVIGFWASKQGDIVQIHIEEFNANLVKAANKFRNLFSIEPKVYLTTLVM